MRQGAVRGHRAWAVVLATSLAVLAFPAAASAATREFSSSDAITIPDSGQATPYPSSISASGLCGNVRKVTVTLNDLEHTWPDDLEVLLVGPSGRSVLLMNDAGDGDIITGVDLTFDDDAGSSLPDEGELDSGTFRPSNYNDDLSLTSPAPGPPYGSSLSELNGTNPNGTYSLYVFDDEAVDVGEISGGWGLRIETSCPSDDDDDDGNNNRGQGDAAPPGFPGATILTRNPRPPGCNRGPFFVTVRGQPIQRVSFYLGRRLLGVALRPGRFGLFGFRLDPRLLGIRPGQYVLTARVSFQPGTFPATATRYLSFCVKR